MDKLLKYGLLLAVTVFFAVMWGLLLRRQMPQGQPASVSAGYAELLPEGQDRRSSTWHISFAGRQIGRADFEVSRTEAGTISVRTESSITLDPGFRYVIGVAGTVDLTFNANVSPLQGLQYFEITSEFLDARLLGTVNEGELTLGGHVGEERVSRTLPYDEQAFLGDMLSPLAPLRELDEGMIGRAWSVDMVNPIAGRVQEVTVTVLDSRSADLEGGRRRVYKLLFVSDTNRWVSWVTEDGRVVLQGTPFGLVLRRSDVPEGTLSALPTAPSPAQTPAD
ncbi:MAG: hypothetical protein R6X33_03420 [Candidatus Brocadiia bacterium]